MSDHTEYRKEEKLDDLHVHRKDGCSSKLGIKSFIFSFGVMGMLSMSLYTVIVSQVTNIEKAFGLSSAETGWLLTVFEIGYVSCSFIAGYFCPRAHVPRALGIVTIICGLSGLVLALPHFLVFEEPKITLAHNQSNRETEIKTLCLSDMKSSTVPDTDFDEGVDASKKTLAFALFNIGMVLMGIGKAPCYPYTSQYIDDNADKRNTAFYISITGSLSIFGWAVGYEAGSLASKFYVTLYTENTTNGITGSLSIFGWAVGYGAGSLASKLYVTLKPTSLANTDPRFIGAWWIGLVVLGLASIIAALPMFIFPRRMKTGHSKPIAKPMTQGKGFTVVLKEIKTALKTVWEILMTPVYTLTLLGSCLTVFTASTFFGFEPKYMETQFAVPAWQANIMIGISSVSSYCVGSLLAGVVTKKVQMTPYITLKLIVLPLIAVVLMHFGVLFIGCPKRDIVPPASYSGFSCDCSNQQFLPICGADKKNYFSPCHAGCTNGTLSEFSDCSLIPGGTAKAELCPYDCSMAWVYFTIRIIQNMTDAFATIPVFLIYLRSAGEDKKGFSVALSAALMTLLAWLPAPVIGGKLVDLTCTIWKTASTSGKFCGYYDTTYQRQLLHGQQIGGRIVGIVLYAIAMYKAKDIPADWGMAHAKGKEDDEKKRKMSEAI